MIIDARKGQRVYIGRIGENETRQIRFDIRRIREEFPDAELSFLNKRPTDADAYPVNGQYITVDSNYLYWTVQSGDLEYVGFGECEIKATKNGQVLKDEIYQTQIKRALDGNGNPPEPWESWQQQVADDADRAEAAAELLEHPGAEAETLAPGSSATAAYAEGVFTFGIPKGDPGDPGAPGFSPVVSITEITGGHRITITDDTGDHTADVMDGQDGQPGHSPVITTSKSGKTTTILSDGESIGTVLDGEDGDPGVSPTVAITQITGGHRITITDESGDHTADVMDGDPTTLIDDTSTAQNKVWSANKSNDLKSAINVLEPTASAGDVGKVLKAKTVADGKVSEYEFGSLPSVPVTDVQVNGTSILNNGVANIPPADVNTAGVIKVETGYGLMMRPTPDYEKIAIQAAANDQIKASSSSYHPIVPAKQDAAVFYGLAKAAGDDTQRVSDNEVGNYTSNAMSKISDMLNAPVSVSGSTPSITGKSGIRYVCGECSTLSITPPASGDMEVIFESGSTATVLTVPNTVKFPAWFDPTSLEANVTYDMIITNGVYGVVTSWAS